MSVNEDFSWLYKNREDLKWEHLQSLFIKVSLLFIMQFDLPSITTLEGISHFATAK